MKPYLHTNGDLLRQDDQLCQEVIRVYETIVIGIYDYETNTQLEHAKQYWNRRLKGVSLQFSSIGLSGSGTADSMGVPRALVPTDTRMALPDLVYSHAPCLRPLVRMIIQYDGEVCNCCEDTSGAFQLGNVFHSSIEQVWFSDHHARIVQDLAAGNREKYDLCRNCPLPPSHPVNGPQKFLITPRRYTLPANR